MKYFILPIFCLCTLLINAQEVITVNNFIAGADYNNLQEAIDSASSGDTIYVSGSPLSYGNATVDKPLTLFGEGYLDGLEVYPSVLGNINIGAEADNSHISGFKINQMYSFNDTENLYVSDCLILGYYYQNGTNGVIEGNIFVLNSINLRFDQNPNNAFATVKNNLFYGYVYYPRNVNNLFINNVFLRNSSSSVPFSSDLNVNSIANVYFGYSSCSCANSGNDLIYNTVAGANPLFFNPDTIAANNNTPFDINHDFQLQAGSPAEGTGPAGSDLGAYGGPTPFKKGGYPPIPRTLSITSSSNIVEAGETIQITIEAKSEQ